MDNAPKIANVAALVGDPTRANMLMRLMDGQARTASELAYVSGVSPPTASGHLAKMTDAGLLSLHKQGRHRYFRIASPNVAAMLEGLMLVAEDGPARHRPRWRGGDALRNARSCYDHMAGRLAVGIADALVSNGRIALGQDGGQLTSQGHAFFNDLGLDLSQPPRHRVFCLLCVDWSERRPHLAGFLGAVLLRHSLTQGWVARVKDSRALLVTVAGKAKFADTFGIGVSARPDISMSQ